MVLTITFDFDNTAPKTVEFIKNAVEGFQLYQMLYFEEMPLDNEVSQKTYREINVSDVNKCLMKLITYHLYLDFYKTCIIEGEGLNKMENNNVNTMIDANDNDYLEICNSCMVLNERFDACKYSQILYDIALKTQNDIDDDVESKNIMKLIDVCRNIVCHKFESLNFKSGMLINISKK